MGNTDAIDSWPLFTNPTPELYVVRANMTNTHFTMCGAADSQFGFPHVLGFVNAIFVI